MKFLTYDNYYIADRFLATQNWNRSKKLNTSFVDTMLIRLQRSMKSKVADAVIKTFATTIVPVHKVQDITERLVFIFNFTDGLYYIVYDADLFGTFKQEVITYYRTDGSNEPVLHYMIPIEQLHRIEI